jgi:iron-sulfur cluster insertion protein
MKVTFKARLFLTAGLQAEGKKYCALSVLSGGCNGLQYQILLLDALPDYKTIEIAPGIVMDEMAQEYLKDCTLDLEETLGYRKIVIKNPSAKSSCSCGTSFSI